MGPLLRFLIAAERLARRGIKKEDIIKFAKQEFGEVSQLLQKQIDKIFTKIKKPKVGKETKKEGKVIPIKEGIMATGEAGSALKRVQEATEKLKEDPKLHANLELTKALQEVDRLTSENVNLNSKLDDFAEEIVKLTDAIQKYTDEQK